jgi:S-adenosylmethionine:tRNA ribosyltransferase-isomerase
MATSPNSDSALSLADYDYALPPELIARTPVRPRDRSRLLVIDRKQRVWSDSMFGDIARHLRAGDLLVLNDTRVLKARLHGRLERIGRSVEILVTSLVDPSSAKAMLKPGRRIRKGDRIALKEGSLFEVGERRDPELRTLSLIEPSGKRIEDLLEEQGEMPLPPYIRREAEPADETDYQTVYGDKAGAIAAPTAGLHFTKAVFDSLEACGVRSVKLTLYVGIGTFIPVRTENPEHHRMQAERFEIPEATADELNRARLERRRIIAVGTTTTRTLEHVFGKHGRFAPGVGETDLYILPGHRFAAVDGLLTNFHLPRSTLLLLVSAFASRSLVIDAYKHAIQSKYRFYSYGDCTLFL